MKNIFKSIFILVLFLLIVCVTGCSFQTPGGSGEIVQNLTKLTIPGGVRLEDEKICWNSVANSSGYVVEINGKEKSTTSLEISIELFKVNYGEIIVRIKTIGNNILYGDSDWSDEYTFEYNNTNQDGEEGNDKPHEASNFGIGYGYDVLNDPYYDNTKTKINPILDLNKIAKYVEMLTQSSGKSGSVYAESMKEYYEQVSAKYYSNISAEASFDIFTAGASSSFELSGSESFKYKSKQIFATYFDYQTAFDYQMKGYGTTLDLQNYLSENFINALSRSEHSATEGMTDKELAEYLITSYGTHLITGVQMGGRLEYSSRFATNDTNLNIQIATALKSSFNGGISGIIGGSTDIGLEANLQFIMNKSEVESTTKIVRYGGSSVGTWSYEELQKGYSEWANSFNDYKNANAIGITDNGMIALWTLIPKEYSNVALEMKAYFDKVGLNVYDTYLEKYSSIDSDNYIDGTLLVDLSSYQQYEQSKTDISAFRHQYYDENTNTFTIYPGINGKEISKVIFKGKYGAKDDRLMNITSKFEDFSIKLDSSITNDIIIEFENFGFIAKEKIAIDGTKYNGKLTIFINRSCYIEADDFHFEKSNVLLSDSLVQDNTTLSIQGFENANIIKCENVILDGEGTLTLLNTKKGMCYKDNELYLTIRTYQDFDNIRNSTDRKYLLCNDIDLSIGGYWTAIPTFSGLFDGNGNTIVNMKIHINPIWDNNTNAKFGLFAENNGIIKNFSLKDSYIYYQASDDGSHQNGSGTICAGLICALDNNIIQDINLIDCSIVLHREKSVYGGVVGSASNGNSFIKNVNVYGLIIEGNGDSGGIVGSMKHSKVENCYLDKSEKRNCLISNYATINGHAIGGIVGYNGDGLIANCVVKNTKFLAKGDGGKFAPYWGIIVGCCDHGEIKSVGQVDVERVSEMSANGPRYFKEGWGYAGTIIETKVS